MRLSKKVAYTFTFSSFVAIFCLGLLSYLFTRSIFEQFTGEHVREIAKQTLDKIDRQLYERLNGITTISEVRGIEELLAGTNSPNQKADLKHRISDLQINTGPWDSVSIFGADSGAYLSTDDKIATLNDLGERAKALFDSSMSGNVIHSDAFVIGAAPTPTMLFAAPIRESSTNQRRVIGVVIASLSWAAVQETMSTAGPEVYLFNSTGDLLDARVLDESGNQATLRTRATAFSVAEQGFLDYAGNDWMLAIPAHDTAISAAAGTTAISLALIILPIIIGALFITFLMVRRFAILPLAAFTKATTRLASGNLSTKINISTNDEIGDLALAFNSLSDKLVASYSRLENEVNEKTRELVQNIDNLEKARRGMLNILEDLEQEKKLIEEKVRSRTAELNQEKGKLDLVAQNMDVGVILLDTAGGVIFHNSPVERILGTTGHTSDEGILSQLLAKFEKFGSAQKLQACLSGTSGRIQAAEEDGHYYTLSFHCITDPNGELQGHAIWVFDITEQKLLEISKTEFLAIASHQLRTPMTVMKWNTSKLIKQASPKLNVEENTALTDVATANDKLIGLVNDMLDLTRIELGTIKFDKKRLDIVEVAKSTIDELTPFAAANKVLVTIEPEVSGPVFVLADLKWLKLVIQNLLSNAIHYKRPDATPGSYVKIKVSKKDSSVIVSVEDNGMGIPSTEQSRIFTRFYRATNAVTLGSDGVGVGLYFTRAAVEQMGGVISFVSKENIGTTFIFNLPLVNE